MNVKVACFIFLAIVTFSCRKEKDIAKVDKGFTICGQMAHLVVNSEFKKTFKLLHEESLTNDFETGWILYPSASSTFRYEKVSGSPGNASVHFEPSSQVDGFLHCHYKKLYPIFSGSDIKAIYDTWNNEQMYDPQTFLTGVVSAKGSVYLLKIADMPRFIAFGKSRLSTTAAFRNFENEYYNKQKEYFSDNNNEILSFEQALLDLLGSSGLIIFKGTTGFDSWKKLEKLVDNSVSLKDCN